MWTSMVAMVVLLVTAVSATERPIIGVLSQETFPLEPSHSSYISAGYVKSLEAAGARSVPIFINRTQEYYRYYIVTICVLCTRHIGYQTMCVQPRS